MFKFLTKLFTKKKCNCACNCQAQITEETLDDGTVVKKLIIPINDELTENEAKKTLSKMMEQYTEEIKFDDNNGELTINGENKVPVSKDIWITTTSDESSTVIESLSDDECILTKLEDKAEVIEDNKTENVPTEKLLVYDTDKPSALDIKPKRKYNKKKKVDENKKEA